AALRADGSVVTWYQNQTTVDKEAASQLDGTIPVTKIYSTTLDSNDTEWSSTQNAFAALRADGSVFTWGSFNSNEFYYGNTASQL
ncbi:hypothetical protein MEO41_29185, partial [Dolichospermum sp. ST_sed4]|nr:hypothetical protein [Dolichospermum sp. ST_sed4]